MTLFLLIFGIIFAFALPTVLVLVWYRRTGVALKPFIVGAIIFIVFAYVLEGIFHSLFLSTIQALDNALIYGLYAGLATGVFEEFGRFFAFSSILKTYDARENAVAYGIGHGGIEVILTIGTAYLVMLAVYLTNNSEAMELMAESFSAFTPGMVAVALLERLIALLFHLSASVLVFTAIRDRRRSILFPLAIILHAVMDFPAGLYQFGTLPIWAVESWCAIFSVLTFIIARKAYKSLPSNAALQEEPEPAQYY